MPQLKERLDTPGMLSAGGGMRGPRPAQRWVGVLKSWSLEEQDSKSVKKTSGWLAGLNFVMSH